MVSERSLLSDIQAMTGPVGLPAPIDAHQMLPTNAQGRTWKPRRIDALQGMVWHQELAWGSIEAVARYYTAGANQMSATPFESAPYTCAIRRSGEIVLCNSLNKATWSQGYADRPGDENAQFLAVMFEGHFRAPGVNDPTAGEPSGAQILAGLLLWRAAQRMWRWADTDLYGHHDFGKAACPGSTLAAIIDAERSTTPTAPFGYALDTVRGRQQALADLGYYTAAVDGVWGPISKAALMEFQDEQRLAPDGVWGVLSEAAIRRATELLGAGRKHG